MNSGPLQVLIVEDSPADAKLLECELRKGGMEFNAVRVDTEPDFITALNHEWDIVLCDWQLPQFDCQRALNLLQSSVQNDVPFIVVSGSIGQDDAVTMMKSGAADYLLKDRLGRLAAAVRQALDKRQAGRAVIRATEALRLSEARLAEAQRMARLGSWGWEPVSGRVWWSEAMFWLLGLDRATTTPGLAAFLSVLHPDDRPIAIARAQKVEASWRSYVDAIAPSSAQPSTDMLVADDDVFAHDFRVLRPDGIQMWIHSRARVTLGSMGRAVYVEGTDIDITERKRNEEIIKASEERHRRLMDVLPDAVFVNSGGKIVFCNPSCVRLFGAEQPAEILGRCPFEFFHPDYHSLIQHRIATMLGKSESVPGIDEKIVRIDGRTVPVYVVATPIKDNGVNAVLVVLTDLTERERTLTLLRSVLDSVTDGILTVNDSGVIQSANPATEKIFGYTQHELMGQSLNIIVPSVFERADEQGVPGFSGHVAPIVGVRGEFTGRRADGSTIPLEMTIAEFELDTERRFTAVVRDIAARKLLEEQFIQAQKMEAVGLLAGGVAHDFNNLLTVICGYAEMLRLNLTGLSGDHALVQYASSIHEAGERASGLTSQLLAFSRKTILSPRVLDLNNLIEHLGKMLHRLIGEDITISLIFDSNLRPVKADPGQLEQVLINLAVNARDAMPCGGRLTIETSEFVLGENDLHAHVVKPGRYARIRITDTGTGIPKNIQARVFEPFFTTKAVGKGTGLGLATAYGILRQAGGSIHVESEPGSGTAFTILLPTVLEERFKDTRDLTHPIAPRGSETILVVEDEPALSRLVQFVLESQGYKVISTSSGSEALAAANSQKERIDLLLTDVVMPGMSGCEVADAFRKLWPGLKVLYASGYTTDTVIRYGIEAQESVFIEKPFTPLALARKVRQTLDDHNETKSDDAMKIAEAVRLQFGAPVGATGEEIELHQTAKPN
ncbi:MAG: PAS domain S-box protein [Planctomyces sp.]|nr:PAS domain S-box protein [Planctomyces sp.]